jgi:hypothetical protein
VWYIQALSPARFRRVLVHREWAVQLMAPAAPSECLPLAECPATHHNPSASSLLGYGNPKPAMRNSVLKFLAAFFAMPLSAFLIGLTGSGFFFLGCIVGLLLSILWGVDLGRQLRAASRDKPMSRAAGLAMGVPQALLGLMSLLLGLTIIAWILYNLLIKLQSQFMFSLLALPVPLMLVKGGAKWLRDAFRHEK